MKINTHRKKKNVSSKLTVKNGGGDKFRRYYKKIKSRDYIVNDLQGNTIMTFEDKTWGAEKMKFRKI